ncbi:MAG TPA: Re/Si-specific NAD(P)(+) transhydrogenase subunit alpha [Streptosporangiaceae bacterium]|nr:Re/Si-specific NAD(P)(+) transhydrogenase subunit alpha [Streptosporangiaceae bacterium]
MVRETAHGERRVALVPEAVVKLHAAGFEILMESGAGDGAWLTDDSFAEAGASVVGRAEALASADAVLMVGRPDEATISALHRGQMLLGLLAPLTDPELAQRLAAAGVTAVSMDMIPRTLPRAQPMDALTSQANIAGYKAALIAAAAFGRFFPLLITAAGTARPARVLVLGTGVAGLQAIGTARRLGAVVSAYDVRPETRTEVESLGGTFIELTSVGPASGTGGYARALDEDERQAQQDELAGHIAAHDVVITTAQVPGRRPPLLVTEDALKGMSAGSVIVDMGASDLGGNVAGSQPGETIVTENGVTVIGAAGLPSTMPTAASSMYARNVSSLLQYLVKDGALAIDCDDDLQAGVIITHDGQVVHPALTEAAPRSGPGAEQTGGETSAAAAERAPAASEGPAEPGGSADDVSPAR